MENLVNNSWFIGIIGGWISAMLSTFSVFLLTYIFTTLMRKKRIENANQFLIDHIRPYIIKGNIPSETLANALRSNASKKFRVKERDLLTLPNLTAEIAAEVVDSSYLQEADKAQYLKAIDDYLSEHLQTNNNWKESVRKELSTLVIISFLISSYMFIGMIECMKKYPVEYNEILMAVQNVDNIHLFLIFILSMELMIGMIIFMPLFLAMLGKIIGDFAMTIKDCLPTKNSDS